jgi:hypothetical protein
MTLPTPITRAGRLVLPFIICLLMLLSWEFALSLVAPSVVKESRKLIEAAQTGQG